MLPEVRCRAVLRMVHLLERPSRADAAQSDIDRFVMLPAARLRHEIPSHSGLPLRPIGPVINPAAQSSTHSKGESQ